MNGREVVEPQLRDAEGSIKWWPRQRQVVLGSYPTSFLPLPLRPLSVASETMQIVQSPPSLTRLGSAGLMCDYELRLRDHRGCATAEARVREWQLQGIKSTLTTAGLS